MKLIQVSEVAWRWYNEGNANVAKQTFRQADIQQAVLMAYAGIMRDLFNANKRLGNQDEYYFYSGDLSQNEYDLTEATIQGMRRALIPEDVVRLPRNADITNVYPIGTCNGISGEVTQVRPGEENFYLAPEFKDFLFFVQKGKGINTYHLPPCVKKIAVERIYVALDMEISLDVAFNIMKSVISDILGVKSAWDKDQIKLREKLTEQEGVGNA